MEEKVKHLRTIFGITDAEMIGLQLPHNEFVNLYKQNKVYFELPRKRDINIFYVIPNVPIKQVILQLLLLPFWGLHIVGVVLLIRTQWLDAVLAFLFAWSWKPLINTFYRNGIRKALLRNPKFYDALVRNGIVRVHERNK